MWESVEEYFERLEQRRDDEDEAMRQRYLEAEAEIDAEREQRISEGSYGKMPR
jgi:guanylate kinase